MPPTRREGFSSIAEVKMSQNSLASVFLLLAVLAHGGSACMNCDRRLWTKFLDLMNRCLIVASEDECSSQLDPVITYTKDFKMVYTETMVYTFQKLMDLIYPFMFSLDYEPLDMLHAFLQVKLKSAVCGDDCSREFPVPVLFCQNCSVIPIFCGASSICGGIARSAPDLPANSRNPDVGEKERPGPFLGLRARRQAEVPIPPEPLVAQKWRVAEMIMFPMIAILLIGLVAVLVIILLWMKQARENSARCNVGFRYLKDEQTVVPTY